MNLKTTFHGFLKQMVPAKWYVIECAGHDPVLVKSHPLHTAAGLLASTKLRPDVPENHVVRLRHGENILDPATEVGGSSYSSHSIFHVVAARPFIGYCRLSSRKQNELYSFAHQRQAIERYVAKLNGTVLEFFEEVASGRKLGRPVLTRALDRCRRANETLVVSKTDRLCRDTASIIDLDRSGVTYHVAELGVDQPRFMLMITASVAEEESLLISKRTRAALAQRKPRPPRAPRTDPERERWQALDAYHALHPGSLDAGLVLEARGLHFPDLVTVFVDACYRRLRLAGVAARTAARTAGETLSFPRLADFPLSTRNWRKIRGRTLRSGDGDNFDNNVHYLGLLGLLAPVPAMRKALAQGNLPEPLPPHEDVARVWQLRALGTPYKAIGLAIGKSTGHCRTLYFESLDPAIGKLFKAAIYLT